MGQEMDDKELELLFDAARAETPQVPQALMARVMADAESVKGGAQTFIAPTIRDPVCRLEQVIRLDPNHLRYFAPIVERRDNLTDAVDQDVPIMDRRKTIGGWLHDDKFTVRSFVFPYSVIRFRRE